MKKIIICSLLALGQPMLLSASDEAAAIRQNRQEVEAYIKTHPEKKHLEPAALALCKPVEEVEKLTDIKISDVSKVEYLNRDGRISYSATLKSGDTVDAVKDGKEYACSRMTWRSISRLSTSSETGEVSEVTRSYPVTIPLRPAIFDLLAKKYNKMNANAKPNKVAS